MPPIHAIVAYSKPTVLCVLHCRLPTYREVDIGNWWSSCHKNLDNLCMSCPGCQVKWAGTLVISAITWCLVAEEQFHDVSEIHIEREESYELFFWNSNTNAYCIFLLMDSKVGWGRRKRRREYIEKVGLFLLAFTQVNVQVTCNCILVNVW